MKIDFKVNLFGDFCNKAWFSVKAKRRTSSMVNSTQSRNNELSYVLPTPTSSTSIITFFNGSLKAECKMIVQDNNVGGTHVSKKNALVLLEFKDSNIINWKT
jgi:hypothetical protein